MSSNRIDNSSLDQHYAQLTTQKKHIENNMNPISPEDQRAWIEISMKVKAQTTLMQKKLEAETKLRSKVLDSFQ